MRSDAYGDYVERMREVLALLRLALQSKQLVATAGCAKGAVVLAAAALERYLNDAVRTLCSEIQVRTWQDLPEGQKKYLTKQFAKRLHEVVEPIVAKQDLPNGQSKIALERAVTECQQALVDPSMWTRHTEFGLFRHGPRVPERITALMRQFSKDGRDPYQELDELGWDRATFLGSLTQLIDARHAAAHALPGGPSLSPKDAQTWIVLSFWMVRRIDHFVARERASGA